MRKKGYHPYAPRRLHLRGATAYIRVDYITFFKTLGSSSTERQRSYVRLYPNRTRGCIIIIAKQNINSNILSSLSDSLIMRCSTYQMDLSTI